MSRSLRFASVLLGLAASALLLAGPSLAATIREVQAEILGNIRDGQYDSAIAVAEAFEPEHPNHAARVAYVRGLVLKAKGENRKAATAFREVLSAAPEQTQAREQLADALLRDGDLDAARHHFGILEQASSDPARRQVYERYSALIDRQKPWSFGGYATMAPSSNVNKATQHSSVKLFGKDFAISEEAKARPGFGVAAGGTAGYLWNWGEGLGLQASISAAGQFYSDDTKDQLRLSGSLKPTWTSEDKSLRFAFGPTGEISYSDWDPTVYRYGAVAELTTQLMPGLIAGSSLKVQKQDFVSNDLRDGHRIDADVSLVKALGETASLSLLAGFAFEKTQAEHLTHKDYNLGLGLSKEWVGGWMTTVQPSVTFSQYDGQLAALPEAQRDTAVTASLQLSNRNFTILNLMPVLNYSFTRQTSNDVYSEYDSHDVSITLTGRF